MYIQWNAQILIVCLLSFDKCLHQPPIKKLPSPQKFPACSIPVSPHNTPPHSPGNTISDFFLCHRLVLSAVELHIDGITHLLHVPAFIQPEKAMAPHSSVLAWRMPGTAEPGGLPSMGSHRVGQDWSDLAAAAAAAFIQHSVFVVHPCHHIYQYLSLFIIDHLYSIIWLNHSLLVGQEDPWNRKWQLTAVFLPGESHGQRSLAGHSPRGCRVGRD